jgi:hypothetical protein
MAAKTLFGELDKIERGEQGLDSKLNTLLANDATIMSQLQDVNLKLAQIAENEKAILALLTPPSATATTLVLTLGTPIEQ